MIFISKDRKSLSKYVYCTSLALLLACGGAFINHHNAHASNINSKNNNDNNSAIHIWQQNGIHYMSSNNNTQQDYNSTNDNQSDQANNLLNNLIQHPNAQSTTTNTTKQTQHISHINQPKNYNVKPKKTPKAPFKPITKPKAKSYTPVIQHRIHRHHIKIMSNGLSHYDVKRIRSVANSKLGDPYAWGGVGPYYFDCSGFTQYVFAHALNKYIPRNAQVQYDVATKVLQKQRKPGDLVFFGSGPNGISHVGIYVGKDSNGNDLMTDAQLNGVETEKIYEPWWNYLVGYGEMK